MGRKEPPLSHGAGPLRPHDDRPHRLDRDLDHRRDGAERDAEAGPEVIVGPRRAHREVRNIRNPISDGGGRSFYILFLNLQEN